MGASYQGQLQGCDVGQQMLFIVPQERSVGVYEPPKDVISMLSEPRRVWYEVLSGVRCSPYQLLNIMKKPAIIATYGLHPFGKTNSLLVVLSCGVDDPEEAVAVRSFSNKAGIWLAN